MTNWLLMILSYVFIKRHIIASNVFTGFTFELYSIRNNMFMILQKTCTCCIVSLLNAFAINKDILICLFHMLLLCVMMIIEYKLTK